jgi:signal transduction histidine kinase
MSEQIVKGKSFRVELLGYTKSKETFWSELYFQPVVDDLGKVQQYFTIQKDITEYKKLQEQLMKEQKNRQQMITAATIKAQEHERANVGLELHDNVNQVLTTVKLYLELCRDGLANRDLMNKSINLVHESINEIRSLSKRLSAPSLGDIKLKESVKELVDTVAASNKIEITLDATFIEELEADQELHLAIYRILQEHLTNILRHANAQLVYISFDIEDNELMLKVLDDGNGFDTRKRKNGVGIANMISRAESLNGTLIIDSAPGLGCVLSARFPLG